MKLNKHTGFGEKSGAVFFDMGAFKTMPIGATFSDTAPAQQPNDKNLYTETSRYAKWGDDNMLPNQLIADIESCGILSGGIDGKARFGIGRGPMPMLLKATDGNGTETLEPVNDAEITEWLEENDILGSCLGWFKDLIGLGLDLARLKFNRAGTKVGLLFRHDVSEMRFQQKNKSGKIENVYLSARWDTSQDWDPKSNDVLTIPLAPHVGPMAFFDAYKGNLASKEFAMVSRLPGWQRHYYPVPLWYSARKWVEIAKGVPEMKAAMFENNIRLKYMVIIQKEYWDINYPDWMNLGDQGQEQARKSLYDDIDSFLAGSKNAYKSIFVDGQLDPVIQERYPLIDIKPIEDNTKQGELLPDSAAANFEILFAIMMTPALVGLNGTSGSYGGGAGSGSDIREAAMVQVMIQEFERQSAARKLSVVSRINGWKDRYPNLVWRFPGLVLTTLDKGKSTEAIVNGQPHKPQ